MRDELRQQVGCRNPPGKQAPCGDTSEYRGVDATEAMDRSHHRELGGCSIRIKPENSGKVARGR
jgi:hypothetical protein